MIELVPSLERVRITQTEIGCQVNDLDAGSRQFARHAHGHPVRRRKEHHVTSGEFGLFGRRKHQIVHEASERGVHGRHLGTRILARCDGTDLNVGVPA